MVADTISERSSLALPPFFQVRSNVFGRTENRVEAFAPTNGVGVANEGMIRHVFPDRLVVDDHGDIDGLQIVGISNSGQLKDCGSTDGSCRENNLRGCIQSSDIPYGVMSETG